MSTYGDFEQVGDRWQLRFTRRLAHRPEKVWQALTEPQELEAWFPTTIEGERTPGAALHFGFRGEPYDPFDGAMLAYDPPRLMELQWGEDRLRFELELEPDGDGTRLTLLDLLTERGKGARDGAGWHVCLDNLERRLAGEPKGDPDAWRPLNEAYNRRFGPEAATIGPPE